MRLITHAAPGCDCAERLGRRQHQALGDLDAPAQHILARRDSKRGLEGAAEMAGAESKETREPLNVNLSR